MLDVDPDRWLPRGESYAYTTARVGLKVAWRYAVWRIVEIREQPEVDWSDDDRAYLARQPAECRRPPCAIVLRHLNGPILVPDDCIDSQGLAHVGVGARQHRPWWGVTKRYPVCSCCGHPWPCMEWDRDRLVAGQAAKTERLLDGARPGVCQACREPVRARQKTVTFPEPSLLVPGAPGPTYHVARQQCWIYAVEYEKQHRMAAYPGATRLVSCPGRAFIHEIGLWVECTAGPACTGLHDVWGARKPTSGTCATPVRHASNLAAGYQRPLSDCGYRGRGGYNCLGSETGPCKPLPDGIADLFGGQ